MPRLHHPDVPPLVLEVGEPPLLSFGMSSTPCCAIFGVLQLCVSCSPQSKTTFIQVHGSRIAASCLRHTAVWRASVVTRHRSLILYLVRTFILRAHHGSLRTRLANYLSLGLFQELSLQRYLTEMHIRTKAQPDRSTLQAYGHLERLHPLSQTP